MEDKYFDFIRARKKKNLSRDRLAEELGIPLHTIKLIESDKWQEAPFGRVISVLKYLNMDVREFLRKNCQISIVNTEIGTDEFEYLVQTNAIARVQLIIMVFDEFCRLTQTRKSDYNLTEVFSDLENLHKLIILNGKLQENSITKKAAISQFKPRLKKNQRK